MFVWLAAPGDSHTITIPTEWAVAAFGADGTTDPLTKRDQHVVDFNPERLGKLFPEREFCLFWSLCRHIAPPVGHPMDMGIDADSRLTVPHGDDQIGGLSSHPLKPEQTLKAIGNLTVKILYNPPANF